LIQLSKNPFKKLEKDLHLGDIVMNDVMPKFQSTLENIDITLETLKRQYEMEIEKKGIDDAVGFTFADFIALYEDKIKNLAPEGKFRNMVADISSKPYKDLTQKQKNILRKVTVSA
jgi:hypothetical protein